MQNHFRLLVLLSTAIFFFSCGEGNKSSSKKRDAKGGVKHGGVFRYNETEYFKSLYPLGVGEVVSHRITNQVYEGLVRFNQKDLSVDPCLAKSWEVDSTFTVYTFHLRTGVTFHNDECFPDEKGREVTARDFVYCFDLLCTPDPKNQGFTFYRDVIKGADSIFAYREARQPINNLAPLGVAALNDSTLQITLSRPYADFLQRLALPFTAVFPYEAIKKYKDNIMNHTVGTGPFIVKAVQTDKAVVLARNENYWDYDEFGNQLPYLDGIKISFIKEDKTDMMEFAKQNLDLKYRMPFSMIDDILDEKGQPKGEYKKFQFQTGDEYAIQYFGFLVNDTIFKNKNLRLAFNYAIDRTKIADYTAKGEGVPAFNGFVPLGIPGYDNSLVKGYTYDIRKAKAYLAKAGYPDGKGLPKITLEINSGGKRNLDVAEAIASMLSSNLNVQIELSQVEWAQHSNNIETGKTNFWRFGWVADYPDPINFLQLFYGKNVPDSMQKASYTNPCRYINPEFDKLYENVLTITDVKERNRVYARLDQMIVDDAPVLLIYYNMNRRMLQPYVRNFPNNGMEYRSFREVWFDK